MIAKKFNGNEMHIQMKFEENISYNWFDTPVAWDCQIDFQYSTKVNESKDHLGKKI